MVVLLPRGEMRSEECTDDMRDYSECVSKAEFRTPAVVSFF